MNTYSWIRDRFSTNPIAQFLLLHCLNVAEATWGLDSYCVCIRAYHNMIPDDLTRDAWMEAVATLQRDGFRQIFPLRPGLPT